MKPDQKKGQIHLSLSKTLVSRLSETSMRDLNTGAANAAATSPPNGDPFPTFLQCNSVMACSGWETCVYCGSGNA